MPNFCRLKKQVNCIGKEYESLFEINSVDCKRRRFGITSSGTVVELDGWGEPIEIDSDVYEDIEFKAKIDKKILLNDSNSVIGGIDNKKGELLVLQIKLTEDIKENDLVEYPIDSGDWYKVEEFLFKTQRTRYLKAYASIRDNK